MVARTPPKQRKIMAALNPALLRETVQKVDQCMARLQELQYTISGGNKVVSGVSLSPRSTRVYLKTSLRCKQESARIKNGVGPRRSPAGKFINSGGEWQRMSLPAMLVGETVGEILQASHFAKEIAAAISHTTKKISSSEDPKTPLTQRRKHRTCIEETELVFRRKKEKQKQMVLSPIGSNSKSPVMRRARSRINFKVSSPSKRETEKENTRYNTANRVSPRHKPWAKKAVLFPNPLFSSTNATTEHNKFCKTRSPIIARNKPKTAHTSPHKFLIKSPMPLQSTGSKFQVKIKSPPLLARSPPKRAVSATRKSPKKMSTVSKLRRSISPSRLANRLVSLSPLKSRRSSVYKNNDEQLPITGLKQRPSCSFPMGISARRI